MSPFKATFPAPLCPRFSEVQAVDRDQRPTSISLPKESVIKRRFYQRTRRKVARRVSSIGGGNVSFLPRNSQSLPLRRRSIELKELGEKIDRFAGAEATASLETTAGKQKDGEFRSVHRPALKEAPCYETEKQPMKYP